MEEGLTLLCEEDSYSLSHAESTMNERDKLSFFFLFNNQTDALIIQIYSVIKLYIFRTTSLLIIRSFLLYIRHW
jgi:hypothetical protein